jgi:hypothetical protein
VAMRLLGVPGIVTIVVVAERVVLAPVATDAVVVADWAKAPLSVHVVNAANAQPVETSHTPFYRQKVRPA